MSPTGTAPALTVRHYGAAPGGHAHDHFQVLWALDGVLELEVEGRGLALSRGQGLVLCQGERHDFESRTGSRCLVLDTHDAAWHPSWQAHRPQREIDWAALVVWADQRFAQPLSVADLAARVHLSDSQFRARCLAVLGCTPMAWVRQLRLAQAQVLRQGGMAVADVAQAVGYDSPSALTAALRRQTLCRQTSVSR